MVFFAFVLASSLIPLVSTLERKKVPKVLAVAVTYIGMLLIVTFISFAVVRPITIELNVVSSDIPGFIENLLTDSADFLSKIPFIDVKESELRTSLQNFYDNNISGTNFISSWFSGADETISALSSIGGFASSLFFMIILSVYIILEHDSFIAILLLRIQNEKRKTLVTELIVEVEQKLGTWLLSQGALMLIIGTLSFIVLSIIGVKFALPLATIAGLLTVIPTLGPIFSSLPAIFVALLTSGFGSAIAVAIGYVLIQQIDNVFITPKIMGNVAGLKPIVVVVGILIGFTLGSVTGAVLTVPILVLLKIAYEFFFKLQKLNKIGQL